jgi:uncharacterized protein YacL
MFINLLDLNVLALLLVAAALLLTTFYIIAKLLHFESHLLFIITSAVILGLVIGGLLSIPLSHLPGIFGQWLPSVVTLMSVTVLVAVFYARRKGFLNFLQSLNGLRQTIAVASPVRSQTGKVVSGRTALMDTSVIIDGRIEELARTGFLPGTIVVPRFVLSELQGIADSSAATRRERGRRGLDVLSALKKVSGLKLEVIGDDFAELTEVDEKLIRLARERGWEILTTDFNLNKVASVEGIRVLNINELTEALRPVILPGEELAIRIVQPGKEKKQGVGYLSDGTMVVVENGDSLINKDVDVKVTRVFQNTAGKMIFAGLTKQAKSGAKATAK